jgi:hypothetical protein
MNNSASLFSVARRRAPVLYLCIAAASTAQSQIIVGAGSSINLGDSQVDIGCSDLAVAGTLVMGSGRQTGVRNLRIDSGAVFDGGSASVLQLSGNLANRGTLSPGSGSVRVVDGCTIITSIFSGASRFYGLAVNTSIGRTLTLPAAVTQAVASSLSLTGSAGAPLVIKSSVAGSAANIDLAANATQLIAYVDVADNHAVSAPIAQGTPASFNSVDGGNTDGWFGKAAAAPTVAIPTLSFSSLAWLSLMVLAIAGYFQKHRGQRLAKY